MRPFCAQLFLALLLLSLLMGALRMRNSALLFQKVTTGMGRASKEAMDIELQNMPDPYEGATVGLRKLRVFQENVDQQAARSVKLPWMEQPQDVRARIEGQAVKDYNQRQAEKPQGRWKMGPGQKLSPGQPVTVNLPGGRIATRTVTKAYPDGTFDAQ